MTTNERQWADAVCDIVEKERERLPDAISTLTSWIKRSGGSMCCDCRRQHWRRRFHLEAAPIARHRCKFDRAPPFSHRRHSTVDHCCNRWIKKDHRRDPSFSPLSDLLALGPPRSRPHQKKSLIVALQKPELWSELS
ncbi:hypothetical protein TIFTF001_037893 [Ficus carica]|uniref:Uncharacterized protein n=1 Tax=Ficus carica TaxID=3494 RepID=A0AA88JD73_FICCA|nr:hypothetical protein TIFTF001_037893 [Ficus carica]